MTTPPAKKQSVDFDGELIGFDKGGVRLHMLGIPEDPGYFLELSTGTVTRAVSVGYQEGTRYICTPGLPWRLLAPSELTMIVSNEIFGYIGSSICLLRLPKELLYIIRQLSAEEVDSACGVVEAGNPVQDLLLGYIRELCTLDGTITCHGLVSNPGNLLTVSYDKNIGQFNGLHVDSWDSPPGHDRSSSPNRICINVGTSERSLLFVNLTLGKMRELLKARSDVYANINDDNTNVGRAFLREFPTYPVVRLKTKPGDAYIAPTENVLHDGCTYGNAVTSWQVTFRAFISPKLSIEGNSRPTM